MMEASTVRITTSPLHRFSPGEKVTLTYFPEGSAQPPTSIPGVVHEVTDNGARLVDGGGVSARIQADGGGTLFHFVIIAGAWGTMDGGLNKGWTIWKDFSDTKSVTKLSTIRYSSWDSVLDLSVDPRDLSQSVIRRIDVHYLIWQPHWGYDGIGYRFATEKYPEGVVCMRPAGKMQVSDRGGGGGDISMCG
jgi:hypothetical protein